MLLTLKLLASGAADWLLRCLSAAGKWLVSDWRNGPLVICAAMWAAHALLIVPAVRADLADTAKLLEDTQIAHLGTIGSYLDASAKAQADAEDNVARVTAEQERITDATLATYRADLGALRARFDRLRASAARTDPRRADPAGLPGAGNAPGRAAAPSGEDRLPAGHLTLADALIASEQALQLNALIDWVEAQSAVHFAPEAPR
jgi:hypothetical protein